MKIEYKLVINGQVSHITTSFERRFFKQRHAQQRAQQSVHARCELKQSIRKIKLYLPLNLRISLPSYRVSGNNKLPNCLYNNQIAD